MNHYVIHTENIIWLLLQNIVGTKHGYVYISSTVTTILLHLDSYRHYNTYILRKAAYLQHYCRVHVSHLFGSVLRKIVSNSDYTAFSDGVAVSNELETVVVT